MKTPYTNGELDALLCACIEFTDDHGQYFITGNIAGRQDVNADIDSVRRIMDWVTELDKGLLEYTGLGQDNVPYFRLGHDARRIMSEGGVKKYFHSKTINRFLEQVRMWTPICISLLALVVSILVWQTPKTDFKKVDTLATQLNELRRDQNQTNASVTTLRVKLDAILPRLPATTPTNR